MPAGLAKGTACLYGAERNLPRPGFLHPQRPAAEQGEHFPQQLCQAAGIPEEKGNPRSLRNLYKVTQKRMDDRLALLRQQMYDEMLEIEQDDIGWRAEPNTSRGCSA